MMARGTDWILKAKLKIEMEPAAIREARATSTNDASWLAESVMVRGRELRAICRISRHSILMVSRGDNPSWAIKGTWMAMWRKAPTATPTAKPEMPRTG